MNTNKNTNKNNKNKNVPQPEEFDGEERRIVNINSQWINQFNKRWHIHKIKHGMKTQYHPAYVIPRHSIRILLSLAYQALLPIHYTGNVDQTMQFCETDETLYVPATCHSFSGQKKIQNARCTYTVQPLLLYELASGKCVMGDTIAIIHRLCFVFYFVCFCVLCFVFCVLCFIHQKYKSYPQNKHKSNTKQTREFQATAENQR